MPWVGDEFTLLYDFQADRNAGPPTSRISADRMQQQLVDIAEGLGQTLNVFGTSILQADYDWNGKKVTNAADGTSATHFATVGQVPTVNDVGTFTQADANTLTATLATAPATIPTGYEVTGRIATANSGAVTFALNGGAAAAVTTRAKAALVAGDFSTDSVHRFRWDGTRWRVVTPVQSELVVGVGTPALTNVAAPLAGNGTSVALDIDFATMSVTDARAIATALMGDATAASTIVTGLTNAPARLTCSASAPTGSNAGLGCFWFETTNLILYVRVNDGTSNIWLDISTPNGGASGGPNSVSTGSIQDGNVTNAKLANMASKTIKGNATGSTAGVSDLTASSVNVMLNGAMPINTVASASGSYTPDMSVALEHDLTVVGSLTIAAPTNPLVGQIIVFRLTQDATGGRTIAFNGAYKFGPIGSPSLSTSANATDYVIGVVRSGSNVEILNVVTGF